MKTVFTEGYLHGKSNPVEIICMKCKTKTVFGEIEKLLKMSSAENFQQSTFNFQNKLLVVWKYQASQNIIILSKIQNDLN